MKSIRKIASLLVVILLIGSQILALDEKKIEIYDVTEDEVLRFISAFPDLKQVIDGGEDESAFMLAIKNAPLQKIDEIAKKNGFKDQYDFMRVCGGVVTGFAHLKLKESEEEMNQSLSELTPEMKAMIKPQLDMIKQQLKFYENKISKGTMAAVQKHYEKIDKLFLCSDQ